MDWRIEATPIMSHKTHLTGVGNRTPVMALLPVVESRLHRSFMHKTF
jgi:hypothetical protein